MKRVRLTRTAERDLDEIWLYIARDNVDAANHFVDKLAARFPLIGASPRMERIRDALKPGVRSHPVENYVIYYRESGTHVSILGIVHGSRDPKRFFS